MKVQSTNLGQARKVQNLHVQLLVAHAPSKALLQNGELGVERVVHTRHLAALIHTVGLEGVEDSE